MGFLHNVVVAVTQPVNCLANLGVDITTAGAKFVSCVVHNFQGII